jgi:carboxyl-terminal processing protease
MKRRILSIILLIATITSLKAQTPVNYQKEAQLLVQTISGFHYGPRAVDNQFSHWVFEKVIEELDPERTYFTSGQISILTKASNSIHEELKGKGWNFLPTLIQQYSVALSRVSPIIEKTYAQPFDFTQPEDLSLDTTWATDDAALASRWKKLIRLDMMKRYNEIRQRDNGKADNNFLKQHETEARTKSKKVMLRQALRLKNHAGGIEKMISGLYLSTIAAAFDPHTAYLSAIDMENFISSLSSKGLNFGIVLDENENGEIVIVRLTPGGPAWNSGSLNTGDIIKDLQWQGKAAIDVTGMSLHEIDEILTEENHSVLSVTVSKPGGLLQSTSLKKELLENDENIVKSFILSGEKKIGFISLPGFYTNWGDEGSECANDVAAEIIKLKKEGIEGLILDLRFNGGGSLQEAVALAGIFIDAGPIGITKNKTGLAQTVKDINRGTVYDGPLMVMVNSFSASASEFVAAALQDYRRAIIVGATTYGKATAQALFPVRPNSTAYTTQTKIASGVGHASITLEKIYRINGKTAQFSGVTPSIPIPEVYDSLSESEAELPMALPKDSVNKKTYYTPLQLLPISELKAKSEKRISESAKFRSVRDVQRLLQSVYNPDEPPTLTWASYQALTDQYAAVIKAFMAIPETNMFSVNFHRFDNERMNADTFIDEYNKTWVKKIKKDISLEEGFSIICDYISILKRESK